MSLKREYIKIKKNLFCHSLVFASTLTLVMVNGIVF